jgi:SAM-dependent methyltransferase
MGGGQSIREAYRRVSGRTPPWTPLYLHHRALEVYVERQGHRILSSFAEGNLRILDVGCGTMPFRRFFENGSGRSTSYEGGDIPGASARATVVVDPGTQAILAETGSYDLVVSFQVLEHSSQPLALLRECFRVLRAGGALFLTIPFMFEYHGVPRDFRRWTHEGIFEDLVSTGFSNVVVEPIESDLHSLLVMNEAFIARHLGHVATKPIFLALNLAALVGERLEVTNRHRVVPLTLGATARKPG